MTSNSLALGRRAWEQYFEHNEVDGRIVRPTVAESWERCRESDISFHSQPDAEHEHPAVLDQRLHEKADLVRVARPFMQDLGRILSGSDFQVVLTDEHGLLLDTVGDRRILSRTREVQLCPGATWSESRKGTNAIGTALIERKPVQIYAWEHFREENQFLICAAAPICDLGGQILGVLDVSGDCRQANPHTLGMVIAVARAIESQLRLEEARHEVHVLSRYSQVLMRGINDGIVAVNHDGIVLDINVRGGQILGITPDLARGASLDCISLGNSPLVQVLRQGQEYENQEIVIDRTGRHIRSSAAPVRDDAGDIVGAVAFFHEIKDRAESRRTPVFYSHRSSFDDIIGNSPAMKAARDWAALAAACCSTVLLLGESGTGKEIFASAIHSASCRNRAPFLAINCAALPETLIESELFGYVDGSFTGARKGGQAGKFELASGGTIFLDEIGEMSPPLQAKLLRVLQERTIQRVGSSREIPVDIRIIAATHRDLTREVEAGRFREDLYYRVAVLEVKIPALRERAEDIPLLARCLMRRITTRLERPPVEITEAALQHLAGFPWPGNVRQLENVLERAAVALRGGTVLTMEGVDLPAVTCGCEKAAPPAPPPAVQPAQSLRDVERQAISEALSSCGGNIKKAAQRLGIARNTLYRKMEEYQLVSHPSSR